MKLTLLENSLSNSETKKLTDLYNYYVGGMLHTAGQYLKNTADIEDVVSKAFEIIIKTHNKFDDIHSNKTWAYICAVVRTTALNELKIQKHETPTPDEELITSIDAAVLGNMKVSQIVDSMADAIRMLPFEHTDILHLRYLYGYDVAEISKMLKLSKDNDYKRIQRAKHSLRVLMEKENAE